MPDKLFCYGTLYFPAVMRRVCGRLPSAQAASLDDHACYALTGRVYPGMVPQQGASVSGIVYSGLGRAQLARLDAYEGDEYLRRRVRVRTAAGVEQRVWTYVLRPRYYYLLTRSDWSPSRFASGQLKLYLYGNHNKLDGRHGRDPTQSA